jgi:tRNA threonylcarbamoyladenosine biosynthesis protein TsaE
VSSLIFEIGSSQEMIQFGERMARILKSGDIVYLMGELGAGKTTLARGLARGLGYQGRVTSPTFTVLNIYQGVLPVYHCDFYRLGEGDACDLGLEDFLEKDGVTLVEWPEQMARALPARGFAVRILLTDNDYDLPRIVQIRGLGNEYEARLEELKTVVSPGN